MQQPAEHRAHMEGRGGHRFHGRLPGRGKDLVVGVDAGGTSTRAGLADADGTVLRTGRAGPGNALSVPPRELAETLTAALAAAVPEAERARVRAVVAGFAGACADAIQAPCTAGGAAPEGAAPEGAAPGPETGEAKAAAALTEALRLLGMAPRTVWVRGDVDIAFASAPGTPADGLALVAGTGAVAVRLAGRRPVASVDGHGWLLGDRGSGFWIGRRALKAVLSVLDGRGRWTSLVPAVTGRLTGAPVRELPTEPARRRRAASALVAAAQSAPPARLGSLCPLVVAAAAEGDTTAARILDAAADRLTDSVRGLSPRAGETLVTSGGLLGPGGPLLTRVRERTAALGLRPVPVPDGVRGACALAAQGLSAGG